MGVTSRVTDELEFEKQHFSTQWSVCPSLVQFFQQDDSERRDLYQGALVVALIYLGVQFLKTFVI